MHFAWDPKELLQSNSTITVAQQVLADFHALVDMSEGVRSARHPPLPFCCWLTCKLSKTLQSCKWLQAARVSPYMPCAMAHASALLSEKSMPVLDHGTNRLVEPLSADL